jgi:DNA-directed RNA polymerase subunit RPC12/RpoP
MSELQEYKCPNCGGAIVFDSASQQMKCPYCDTEMDVEAVKTFEREKDQPIEDDFTWEKAPDTEWQEEGVRVYVCDSCGGEIIAEETTAATTCPYCDNAVVMKGQVSGALKPDLIIPFQVSKEAAIRALKAHFQGKKLLPSRFKDENHIKEIKGVYVPFWLFDATAQGNVRFHATRTRGWSDSKYIYTKTSHYSVTRRGSLKFSGVPVDGSSKMADDLMESLEPYDLSRAVDFRTAYMAGYLADKYDVDADASIERANERIKTSTTAELCDTVIGYDTVIPEAMGVALSEGKAQYALYPVWLLYTEWQGQKYVFAMNGQTGKFVGDLPMDKKKANLWTFGIAAAVAAGLTLLGFLLGVIG